MEVEAATGIGRVDFAGEIDEFDKRAANLPKEKKSQTASAWTGIESKQQEEEMACNDSKRQRSALDDTYIYCDVADDGCVVWQADITRLVMRRTDSAVVAAVLRRCCGIRVDDEGALDIDLDAAGACDGVVNLLSRGHGARPLCCAPGLVVGIVSVLLVALPLQLVMVVWRGCRDRLVGRYRGRHCPFFACSSSAGRLQNALRQKKVEDANQLGKMTDSFI